LLINSRVLPGLAVSSIVADRGVEYCAVQRGAGRRHPDQVTSDHLDEVIHEVVAVSKLR
jgi:hypothetical protein